ncbi:MAG: hypothetical protein K0S76_460 [Herbinix sp.]|jgi:hypothetical protein|nr:hypothetical protein [Herbinix sp.]
MSDLISRKNLLNDIEEYFAVNGAGYLGNMILTGMKIIIERQPTAYNVDKVVEQLEERKADNIRISKLQGNPSGKKIACACRADEDDFAIRLVKGAVKDE